MMVSLITKSFICLRYRSAAAGNRFDVIAQTSINTPSMPVCTQVDESAKEGCTVTPIFWKVIRAGVFCAVVIMIIFTSISHTAAKEGQNLIDSLAELMIHEKIGRVVKPNRQIRVSLVTAETKDYLLDFEKRMKEINGLARYDIFLVNEIIENANRKSSQRVNESSDAVIIVGKRIMHYGIRTFGFHIIDFVNRHSSKDFLTLMTEMSSGEYKCKLYRWNKENSEVDKYLMFLDYGIDLVTAKKCEILLTLNVAGVFAQESDLILDSSDNEGGGAVVKLKREVDLAVAYLYDGRIVRGDSKAVLRDKLHHLVH